MVLPDVPDDASLQVDGTATTMDVPPVVPQTGKRQQAKSKAEAETNGKGMSKKGNGKQRKSASSGNGNRAASTNDTDDKDDDMAFLDQEVKAVRSSHGRTIEGRQGYRDMMSDILLTKPEKKEETTKHAKSAGKLRSKLRQAQDDRKGKKATKTKKRR